MKNGKLSLDEMSKNAETLSHEDQLKMLGGRRGRERDVVNSWSNSRGGIIEEDLIIRFRLVDITTKRG